VGGVIALIAVIAITLLCLRRKHRNKTTDNPPELDTNTNKSELHGVSTAQKPTAMPSASPAPAYSPPHHGEQWVQQGGHTYPHYAQSGPYEISAELPEVRSPVSAELPDVRSPVSAEISEVRSPVNGELPGAVSRL
jgi:hypothetical protein